MSGPGRTQPLVHVPAGTRVVLASGSPRRADLLASIGLAFEVRPADVDESIRPDESPEQYVVRLSADKAATATGGGVVAIGADTTVELDGEVLGKPTDADDARRMLGRLSGRPHRVHTGVTVVGAGRSLGSLVTSEVRFTELDPDTIEWYVGTGEPMDKAGGYALQGSGGALVARVDGSVTNVIGLPLAETVGLLRSALAPHHHPEV